MRPGSSFAGCPRPNQHSPHSTCTGHPKGAGHGPGGVQELRAQGRQVPDRAEECQGQGGAGGEAPCTCRHAQMGTKVRHWMQPWPWRVAGKFGSVPSGWAHVLACPNPRMKVRTVFGSDRVSAVAMEYHARVASPTPPAGQEAGQQAGDGCCTGAGMQPWSCCLVCQPWSCCLLSFAQCLHLRRPQRVSRCATGRVHGVQTLQHLKWTHRHRPCHTAPAKCRSWRLRWRPLRRRRPTQGWAAQWGVVWHWRAAAVKAAAAAGRGKNALWTVPLGATFRSTSATLERALSSALQAPTRALEWVDPP